MKAITSENVLLVGFGLSQALLLMLTLTASFMYYDNEKLKIYNDTVRNCRWRDFWFIVALNSALWIAKFSSVLQWQAIGTIIMFCIN